MATNFNWQCPFCEHHSTITGERVVVFQQHVGIENALGQMMLSLAVIVCPNKECRQPTIGLQRYETILSGNTWVDAKEPKDVWRVRPQRTPKTFPNYVPEAIRVDYQEAWAVLQASPKASATLARRCLQGMIRDFWGVRKDRLVDEINALSDKIDPVSWSAIDAVRTLGNIGAHMEKDVNVIVDVAPGEAKLLVHLIETLIREWYVNRHEREERMKAVIAAADSKKAPKALPPPHEATFVGLEKPST